MQIALLLFSPVTMYLLCYVALVLKKIIIKKNGNVNGGQSMVLVNI